MTLYTHKEANIRKTWLYLFSFCLLIITVGAVISYLLNSYFVLVIAVVYSVSVSFLGYWHSGKIVLKMAKAKPIEKKDNPELYRIVENLCITAGLPLPKIYIIESEQPNAFATGRNPEHGVVAVTRGLLRRLERVELEGVIAHELSHIGNRDTLLQTIVVVLVGVVVMMSHLFWRISFFRGGSSKGNKGGQVRAILMIIGLVLIVLAPVFAQLIKLAISRKREFLADASGALLTRYPEGLARALEKISKDPHSLKAAKPSMSHLFIASPFRGKEAKSWFNRLFSTHPSLEQRVEALRGMEV